MSDKSKEELDALMVFLANDTLDADERAEVEAYVAEREGAEEEMAALMSIRAEMQAEEDTVNLPGEFGIARLMRDIDREGAEATPIAAKPTSQIWKIAAVVATALFLGQIALNPPGQDEGVTLAEGELIVDLSYTIQVTFVPSATEADIRALLTDLDLTIRDGPSALGIYVLSAPDAAALEAALEALRARQDLVESAEP